MPSDNFQGLPIDKEPDVILSILGKDDSFISAEEENREEGERKRAEFDDPLVDGNIEIWIGKASVMALKDISITATIS
ncbi:MAG TPA: hypothetical protein PLD16_08935 [Fervidobacterium sp.]|nr:hypothetical protein [Fervidobacterium sp.]HQE50442.1 hypothetical protein [Fervidobacterium sp.]